MNKLFNYVAQLVLHFIAQFCGINGKRFDKAK